MVERLCPRCQAGNRLEAPACERCGASLQEQLPARRRSNSLAPLRKLPTSLRRAAQPIAIGLAAVAVEIGAALLQRHQAAAEQKPQADQRPITPQQTRQRTTIGQRVWEEYSRDGSLRRRIIEQFIIRGEE